MMCLVETRAQGPRPPERVSEMTKKMAWDASKDYSNTALYSCAPVDIRASYRVEFDLCGRHYNLRAYSRYIWRNMAPWTHVADFVKVGASDEKILVDDLNNVKKIYDK
jgi:hypothetical protein